VIYGLAAALGWGIADFSGAIGGRRIGSVPTVVIGQLLSTSFMVILVVATGQDVARVGSFLGLFAPNGIFTAMAYVTTTGRSSSARSRRLPIGASYAVVRIGLAMLIRDEQPERRLIGAAVTVVGVAPRLDRSAGAPRRIRSHAPGVPSAIASPPSASASRRSLLGRRAERVGSSAGASRVAGLIAYLPSPWPAAASSRVPRMPGAATSIAFALCAGAADLLGVTASLGGADRPRVACCRGDACFMSPSACRSPSCTSAWSRTSGAGSARGRPCAAAGLS
jgi:uncharacterized membrane protein